MKNKITYYYAENQNILIRNFEGIVTVDDIIYSWKDCIEQEMINENCKGVISDFLQAYLQVSKADLKTFEKFYDEYEKLFTKVKITQIIDSSLIAFPILLEYQYKKNKSKAFSTVEAATDWIAFNE